MLHTELRVNFVFSTVFLPCELWPEGKRLLRHVLFSIVLFFTLVLFSRKSVFFMGSDTELWPLSWNCRTSYTVASEAQFLAKLAIPKEYSNLDKPGSQLTSLWEAIGSAEYRGQTIRKACSHKQHGVILVMKNLKQSLKSQCLDVYLLKNVNSEKKEIWIIV